MKLVPMTITRAKEFIALYHRHHKPPQGALFALAVADESGRIAGVATVGRPVARALNDGQTAEVTRLCTDGSANACSMLYGAAWRAARALGYKRMLTYTMGSESGASLRAVGWLPAAKVRRRSWSTPSRPRMDKHPICVKVRWEISCK